MFKTYEKYIVGNFTKKIILLSLIFFCLIVILSVLEEISFFKSLSVNFLTPYLITFLGAPITLFEVFPFIFLLSTQFLFYDLFKRDELNLLKTKLDNVFCSVSSMSKPISVSNFCSSSMFNIQILGQQVSKVFSNLFRKSRTTL